MLQAEEDLLVLAAQDGDQRAFEQLYKKYYKSLLHYAFKSCQNQEIAQDAVQNSWLKLAKNIRKLEDPRVFRSWLYKTVRWCVIDLARVTSNRRENEDFFKENQHSDVNDNDFDGNDDLSYTISRLPSVEKQMIHLFYLEELKLSEIAIILDIPIGTVKSRLNRARKQLKNKFECQ